MLNLLADLMLPPAGLAMAAFVLLLLGWRRLGAAALAVLLVLGMPVVPSVMLAALDPPAEAPGVEAPQAIVILSGDGVALQDPPDLAPGLLTLDRLREGVALQRRTGLPILVTGGPTPPPPSRLPSLAAMMARSLQQDFQSEARWTEGGSNDTWENAAFSAAILRQAGIDRVYIVTQAWHQRRALLAFRHFGMQAVAAPVRPDRLPQWRATDFVPRASGWLSSYYALHEAIGLAAYALRR